MDLRLACLALALAASGLASAAPVMNADDRKAQLVRIEEQYDHAQTRCRRVEGRARALCNEQARGERDIQVAELDLRADPTPEHDQKLRLAKAEATYSMALLKCKTLEGQGRDVCRGEAKRSYAEAQSEAKLQREVAEQVLKAEGSVRLRAAESERIAEAQFNAARIRCDALPAEGRANCLADAKQRFGKE